MILILMGKTASGKDSVAKELVRNYGFRRIVTYTTRPPRKAETEGVDYHFISRDDFLNKVNNRFFLEWKTYDTENGKWYYGTSLKDFTRSVKNSVIVLTPNGIRDLKSLLRLNYRVVYLDTSNETIMDRIRHRGDDLNEAMRRIDKDNGDFANAYSLASLVINTNNLSVEKIAQKISKYWDEENAK